MSSGAGQLNFIESFTLSGIAAVLSKTASAPLERIKLLIQNQDEMIKQGIIDKPYNGILDCGKRIVETEGIGPLWRGNVANCIRYIPTQGFNFAFKDIISGMIDVPPTSSHGYRLFANLMAGGCAGSMSLLFVYPLDYARTRLANDAAEKTGKPHYNGLVDVWVKTFRAEGFRGLYRGFAISVLGIFYYRSLFFGLYDFAKPLVLEDNAGVLALFMLGYLTTVFAEVISYPTDTIRRRMMMTSEGGEKYKSAWDCTKKIIVNEGAMSMMKGAGANILRGIAGAMVLAGFDSFQKMYINWRDGTDGGGGGGGGPAAGSSGGHLIIPDDRPVVGVSMWGAQGGQEVWKSKSESESD